MLYQMEPLNLKSNITRIRLKDKQYVECTRSVICKSIARGGRARPCAHFACGRVAGCSAHRMRHAASARTSMRGRRRILDGKPRRIRRRPGERRQRLVVLSPFFVDSAETTVAVLGAKNSWMNRVLRRSGIAVAEVVQQDFRNALGDPCSPNNGSRAVRAMEEACSMRSPRTSSTRGAGTTPGPAPLDHGQGGSCSSMFAPAAHRRDRAGNLHRETGFL